MPSARALLSWCVHLVLSAALGMSGAIAAAPSDFNGDGKSDILWRNTASGQNGLWLMNALSASFTGPTAPVPDLHWEMIGAADFDADGKADILWRHRYAGSVAVWLMNGDAIKQSAVVATVPLDWQIATTGDANGDGKCDIVWRGPNGEVAVWLMNGIGILTAAVLLTVPDSLWTIAGMGDFNADGKADLFWRHTGTGDNAIWLLDGASVLGTALTASVPSQSWTIAAFGDFDGDGRADVLWTDTSGLVAIWLMQGAAIKAPSVVASVSDTLWAVAGVGDYNGDGRLDVLWRHKNSGDNAIWLLNGTTITASGLITSVSDRSWRIAGARGFEYASARDPVLELSGIGLEGGTGRIVLSDGTACDGGCTRSLVNVSNLTLTAVPDPGSKVAGWSGTCTGTNSCAISKQARQSAAAVFVPDTPAITSPPPVLPVRPDGRYTGTISGAPVGDVALVFVVENSRIDVQQGTFGSGRMISSGNGQYRADGTFSNVDSGGACTFEGTFSTEKSGGGIYSLGVRAGNQSQTYGQVVLGTIRGKGTWTCPGVNGTWTATLDPWRSGAPAYPSPYDVAPAATVTVLTNAFGYVGLQGNGQYCGPVIAAWPTDTSRLFTMVNFRTGPTGARCEIDVPYGTRVTMFATPTAILDSDGWRRGVATGRWYTLTPIEEPFPTRTLPGCAGASTCTVIANKPQQFFGPGFLPVLWRGFGYDLIAGSAHTFKTSYYPSQPNWSPPLGPNEASLDYQTSKGDVRTSTFGLGGHSGLGSAPAQAEVIGSNYASIPLLSSQECSGATPLTVGRIEFSPQTGYVADVTCQYKIDDDLLAVEQRGGIFSSKYRDY